MIKAVFFDIDGTLITSRNKVLPSTIESLYQLRQQHIPIGIATSRGPHMLPAEVRKIPFDYYIFYNGQLIYRQNETILANHPFSFDNQQCFLREMKQRHLSFLFETANKTYGDFGMKIAQSDIGLPIVHHIKDHLDQNWIKRICMMKRTFSNPLNCQMRTLFPVYQAVVMQSIEGDESLQSSLPMFHLTRSNPFTAELVNIGTSKVSGLVEVARDCRLTLDEILFFGDSYNDIEVMKQVRHGVAMANAIRELREVSSFVTTSNQNDGIRNALKYFHLI